MIIAKKAWREIAPTLDVENEPKLKNDSWVTAAVTARVNFRRKKKKIFFSAILSLPASAAVFLVFSRVSICSDFRKSRKKLEKASFAEQQHFPFTRSRSFASSSRGGFLSQTTSFLTTQRPRQCLPRNLRPCVNIWSSLTYVVWLDRDFSCRTCVVPKGKSAPQEPAHARNYERTRYQILAQWSPTCNGWKQSD